VTYEIEFPYWYLRVGERELYLNVAADDLLAAMGEPLARQPLEKGEVIRWPGVDARADKSGDIVEMQFRLRPLPDDPEGTTYYDGSLVCDRIPITGEPNPGREWVGNDGIGGPAVCDEDGYVARATVKLKNERPENDFTIRQPRGKVLEFTDFGFKLLVIDELMYNQEILDPPFYLDEYAEHAGIDLEQHLGETIEGARAYFEQLPIPAKFAKEIEELEQDGGLQIYQEIAYQWDGEDGRFDVKSVRDAGQLKKLTRLALQNLDDVAGLDGLPKKVEVQEA